MTEIAEVIEATANHFGAPQEEFIGSPSNMITSYRAAVAVYVARKMTDIGFRRIARAFGRGERGIRRAFTKIESDVRANSSATVLDIDAIFGSLGIQTRK